MKGSPVRIRASALEIYGVLPWIGFARPNASASRASDSGSRDSSADDP
jgi:hypothetical protein